MALSPSSFHTATANNDALETYDPHIAGAIVDIVPKSNGRARVRIVNECARSLVNIAEVDVPYAADEDGKSSVAAIEAAVGRALALKVDRDELLEVGDVDIRGSRCGGTDCATGRHEEWADLASGDERDWESDEERQPDPETMRRSQRQRRKPVIVGGQTEERILARKKGSAREP